MTGSRLFPMLFPMAPLQEQQQSDSNLRDLFLLPSSPAGSPEAQAITAVQEERDTEIKNLSLFEQLTAPLKAVSEIVGMGVTVPVRAAMEGAGTLATGGTVGEAASNALSAGTRPPLEAMGLVLNELARPQKAMFAGLFELGEDYALDDPLLGVANGIKAFLREGIQGAGTGRFEKDLTYGDLLFRDTPREDRSMGQRLVGLGGDIIVDPLNVLDAAPARAVYQNALKRMGTFARHGITTGKNLAPDVISRNADRAVEMWRNSFIQPIPETPAGVAANILPETIDGYADAYRRQILVDFKTDNARIAGLANEMDIPQDQLADSVRQHLEWTKIDNAVVQGTPRNLEDTIASVYNETGVDGYNQFMRDGGRRRMVDEKPMRRAIFRQEFDEIEPAYRNAFGDKHTEEVQDLIFELKERHLDNMVFDLDHRKATDAEGARRMLYESMEKDHLALVASPELKQAIANLPGRPNTTSGAFEMTPFHAGELSSALQDTGISHANELLRTPKFPGSSESKFFLRNPDGSKTYLPIIKQGFRTDPLAINAVRGYYSRLAVEKSQMLDDLVRGFGRVLPESSFKPSGRVIPGRHVEDARANLVALDDVTDEVGRNILTRESADLLSKQGLKKLSIPGFENAVLPEEAADIVMTSYNTFNNPEKVADLWKALDTVQNKLWKPWTLFPWPGTLSRNVVTNTVLMGLAAAKWGGSARQIPKFTAKGMSIVMAGTPKGVRKFLLGGGDLVKPGTADIVAKIGGDEAAMTKRLREVLDAGPVVQKDKPLYEQAQRLQELVDGVDFADVSNKDALGILRLAVDLGVARSGQFGTSEIAQTLEAGMAFTKSGKLKKLAGNIPYVGTADKSPLLQAGIGAWGAAEDSARVGLWIWGMEEGGMDVLTAAEHAKKWMVNYNKLTTFEKSTMKAIFPFYAWSRKSIPLMFESLIMDPQKWNRMNKVKRDMEEQMYAEGEAADHAILIPEYVARGFGVPTRRSPQGDYQYFLFDNWIPQAMLAQIDSLEELKRGFVAQNMSPLAKSALEILFEKSLFMDAEFTEGKTDFAGMRVEPETASILRNLRVLGTIDMFTRRNNPGLVNNMTRLLTGFQRLRVSEQQAAVGAQGRFQDVTREVSQAVMRIGTAVAEGTITEEEAALEIAALQERLNQFAQEGR